MTKPIARVFPPLAWKGRNPFLSPLWLRYAEFGDGTAGCQASWDQIVWVDLPVPPWWPEGTALTEQNK